LKQSPQTWFNKFSIVVAHYGLRQSSSDHCIFVKHFSVETIILAGYVDIIVTKDDHQSIIQLKAYLSSHFHVKDFGLLRYFLGIEVDRSLKDLFCHKENILFIGRN